MAEKRLAVRVKCVVCDAKREIAAGEISADDIPMCDACFSPMIAESAVLEEQR